MVYVFIANGFEEIEAIAPIDILRRADIDVVTVGIGDKVVTGAHGVTIATTLSDNEVNGSEFDMIILPGGGVGSVNLAESKVVSKMISRAIDQDKYIAAICASPAIVLGKKGLIAGKKAVCYPGLEKFLKDVDYVDENVVIDGKLITAKGSGVSNEFGFTLLECLKGKKIANKVKADMQWPNSI